MYTKEEAGLKSVEMLNNSRGKYCPLIGDYCTEICECYKMPIVVNRAEWFELDDGDIENGNVYDVVGGCCTCYMLKGEFKK